MIRTSYRGIKTLKKDYKDVQKEEWRRYRMTKKQITEEVPKSSIKGSDTLRGMFR